VSTSEIVERLLTAPGPLSTEDRRAAAARIDQLERENARLREIARLAQECADDLEAEVKSRWIDADGSIHPALQRKFDRDMSIVIELRAALAGSGEK